MTKCSICKTNFKNLIGLNTHIALKHKDIPIAKYYEKYLPSYCKVCKKVIPYPIGSTNVKGYLQRKVCSQECKNLYNGLLISKSLKGNIPWNKGKDKETDIRIKNYGKKNASHFGNREWHKEQQKSNPKEYRQLKQKASIEANRTLAKSSKTGSYPELYLRDKLKEINIGFEFQYPIVIGENLSIVDIFIKPNICIFVDGEYWHNYPSGTEKDKMVNEMLPKMGYKVLRFWSLDVTRKVNKCLDEVYKTIPRKDPIKKLGIRNDYTLCPSL